MQQINNHKNKIAIILSWMVVLLWLILIFYFSSQPAVKSDGLSRKVTEVIIEKVGRLVQLDSETSTTTDLVSKFNHIVRKFAHFGVYFVLGILVMNGFRTSGIRGSRAFIFSLILCVLYAASDEVHQIFVSGRGAQVTDVLIDSFGSFVGIGIYKLIEKIKERIKFRS
ncbi:VanZ like family protein [Caloranaerobacter azorensis DSM 13643]|uniref:VanZ like family protein n=1 Tax=Caloranaerobacter azorensis DSM 13643 TaxID=1121264 RepID=A0A1M5VZF5_9FIRM|nr:VanZ family protein [Caloranaerobacter azorensis]SHH80558.1 VanZ like family protein [Caloranaerobacter azorensis DSM 13643]